MASPEPLVSLAALGWPVSPERRFLCQKARRIKFAFKCGPKLGVLGSELRSQLVAILFKNVLQGFDKV
jgi:hypothetical protein